MHYALMIFCMMFNLFSTQNIFFVGNLTFSLSNGFFLYACIFIMVDNKAIVHCLTEFQNESNNQATTTVNLIVPHGRNF